MILNKKSIVFIFCFLPYAVLFSFDYGLELANTVGIKETGDFDWYTNHKETVWSFIPFGNTENSFSIEGSFYGTKPAFSDDFLYFIDLDLFKFSFLAAKKETYSLAIDAGRIQTSDITGNILNQYIDGGELHITLPFANIDFLAAYTGLLNVRKGTGLISADDYKDAQTQDMYGFGSNRLVSKATMQFPQLIGNVDILFEVLGQYDLKDVVSKAQTETIHTMYNTIGLTGPLHRNIYYSLFTTLQLGIREEIVTEKIYSETSILATGRLDFFLPHKNYLFVKLDFNNANTETLTGFLPITYSTAGSFFTQGLANNTIINTGWNWTPMQQLNTNLNFKVFFANLEKDSEDKPYQGIEAGLGFIYKAFNDLKFHLHGSLFFDENSKMYSNASLKIVFAL